MERVGDLLFELSNDDRRRILLSIKESPKRLTQIAQSLDLTLQEVSRQLSRLEEVDLEYKDSKGYHYLTPYGELVLSQLRGFEFTSRFREYWKTHSANGISSTFIDRIGDLTDSILIVSAMDFLRHTEKLLKEANEYVLLLVDQFPLNSLSTIVEAIERGVQFKIIEPVDRVITPDLDSMTSEETRALNRARHTPLVEQKMLDKINAFLYLSENRCVLAFPVADGKYDYTGFTAIDESSLKWCKDLFQHHWDKGHVRTPMTPSIQVKRGKNFEEGESKGQIVVVGRERPEIDVQAVQDAVDNFNEVILRGTFNFGTSHVKISRSVIIRGEGRENDIPTSTVYKKGWSFPFLEYDCLFYIYGEDADVTIENIRFTDFNAACIWGLRGNSLLIKDNYISVLHGFGRGATVGSYGDWIVGIEIDSEEGYFKGGVMIEGNYIDFSSPLSIADGHMQRGGLEEDPEYRPDLINHKYFVSMGVATWNLSGKVIIENNIIRNINAKGITSSNNAETAEVKIRHNTVTSDVYGSYLFSSNEAGAGIVVQSAMNMPAAGFKVEIEDNTVKMDKVNFNGIMALGPATDREGSDKLKGGVIRNNRIFLKDGYEGIHLRKVDDFEVLDNEISGQAYYGIRVSGRKQSGKLDLRALNNYVNDNDITELCIKDPDEYSNRYADGRRFAGSEGSSITAHVWLDKYTQNNVVKLKQGETLIDEGKSNIIKYVS